MMIIFLDFDGVLHAYGKDTFEFVPLLAEVMDDFPEARIVISSSWREVTTMPDMLARLGPLGDRVVGTTPVFPAVASIYSQGMPRAVRQKECEAWMDEHAQGFPWVAIDDFEALFKPNCASLVVCQEHIGFSVTQQAELREHLEGIREVLRWRAEAAPGA